MKESDLENTMHGDQFIYLAASCCSMEGVSDKQALIGPFGLHTWMGHDVQFQVQRGS